jgi:hypothetical protein
MAIDPFAVQAPEALLTSQEQAAERRANKPVRKRRVFFGGGKVADQKRERARRRAGLGRFRSPMEIKADKRDGSGGPRLFRRKERDGP